MERIRVMSQPSESELASQGGIRPFTKRRKVANGAIEENEGQ
jgi:hypothetical protein